MSQIYNYSNKPEYETTKTVSAFRCLRCGHVWIPRIYVINPDAKSNEITLPRICVKCKSPYWNIPRKNKRNTNTKH